jgi:predicted dienelactone hydrolase
MIALLSMAAAYVITRSSGGGGFPAQSLAADPDPKARAAFDPAGPDRSAKPVPSTMDGNGYRLATGPHPVTEIEDLVLHDVKRNKDVHIRVFYPSDSGKYPVIIFSHGAGGSQNCCDSLTRHWATYGYVTIQPTHDDSAVERRNGGEEKISFAKAVREALKNPDLWRNRPLDISYLVDVLPMLGNRVPGLVGKINADRIGVGGHSMGSYTAEAIAGALIDLPGQPGMNFADPRVEAVLCLSPQGPGQFGLQEHSFDQMAMPFMGMTGSLDSLGPVASPAWHMAPFERSRPGDKYHVFIEGANHMSFITPRTLLPNHSERAGAILDYTNSASLAFWDAYLKGDPRAKSYLQSDELEKSSHRTVKVSRR